jgi:hypothetical protein
VFFWDRKCRKIEVAARGTKGARTEIGRGCRLDRHRQDAYATVLCPRRPAEVCHGGVSPPVFVAVADLSP